VSRTLWRLLIGIAGGLAGAVAMNVFGRIVVGARGGREATGAAPGADRSGRGVQPPQAEHDASDDATVRVGRRVYRAVTRREPRRVAEMWLGSAAHYAFSGVVGAAYGILSGRVPVIRAGRGTLYGTLVWIAADEIAMPALRLSRGPRQLPWGVHAYALAGHWVFASTLDAVYRATFAAVADDQRTTENRSS
jgi:putative membrane protein